MNTPKLELYFFDSCPYCQLVLNEIKKNKIKIDQYFDTLKDKSAREKLVQDTGRRTVPCLYIDGKPMHESSDIARWLNDNKDRLKKES